MGPIEHKKIKKMSTNLLPGYEAIHAFLKETKIAEYSLSNKHTPKKDKMTAQILPLDTTRKCTFVLILVKLIYFLVAIFATKDNFPSYPFVKLTNSSAVVVQYDNHKLILHALR